MKILIGVAHHAYSFVIQAKALYRGFLELGIDAKLVYIDDEVLLKTCKDYLPTHVITVGNWIDAPIILPGNVASRYRVIPWIVCDDFIIDKYVDSFNNHGIVFTTSFHCRDNLVRSGVKKEIMTVIPEAVDSVFWKPLTSKEIRKFAELLTLEDSGPIKEQKYNLVKAFDDDVPIIFTTGGDATKKGAQEVIKALSLLDKKLKWIYLIKTWPSVNILKRSLEELVLIQELGIQDRVRYFVGEFSDDFIKGLFNLCDIYAAPSRSEGFGLPHVEAQMSGKPVVTIGATAAGETIVHKKTGFLVKNVYVDNQPRADILDLSKKLDRLIRSKSLRNSMGKKARELSLKRFSPSVIAQDFLNTIKSRFNT